MVAPAGFGPAKNSFKGSRLRPLDYGASLEMVEVAGFEPATAIPRSRLRVWCVQPLYKTSKKVSGSGGGIRTRNVCDAHPD